MENVGMLWGVSWGKAGFSRAIVWEDEEEVMMGIGI